MFSQCKKIIDVLYSKNYKILIKTIMSLYEAKR
jgi:hypothetical protein